MSKRDFKRRRRTIKIIFWSVVTLIVMAGVTGTCLYFFIFKKASEPTVSSAEEKPTKTETKRKKKTRKETVEVEEEQDLHFIEILEEFLGFKDDVALLGKKATKEEKKEFNKTEQEYKTVINKMFKKDYIDSFIGLIMSPEENLVRLIQSTEEELKQKEVDYDEMNRGQKSVDGSYISDSDSVVSEQEEIRDLTQEGIFTPATTQELHDALNLINGLKTTAFLAREALGLVKNHSLINFHLSLKNGDVNGLGRLFDQKLHIIDDLLAMGILEEDEVNMIEEQYDVLEQWVAEKTGVVLKGIFDIELEPIMEERKEISLPFEVEYPETIYTDEYCKDYLEALEEAEADAKQAIDQNTYDKEIKDIKEEEDEDAGVDTLTSIEIIGRNNIKLAIFKEQKELLAKMNELGNEYTALREKKEVTEELIRVDNELEQKNKEMFNLLKKLITVSPKEEEEELTDNLELFRLKTELDVLKIDFMRKSVEIRNDLTNYLLKIQRNRKSIKTPEDKKEYTTKKVKLVVEKMAERELVTSIYENKKVAALIKIFLMNRKYTADENTEETRKYCKQIIDSEKKAKSFGEKLKKHLEEAGEPEIDSEEFEGDSCEDSNIEEDREFAALAFNQETESVLVK